MRQREEDIIIRQRFQRIEGWERLNIPPWPGAGDEEDVPLVDQEKRTKGNMSGKRVGWVTPDILDALKEYVLSELPVMFEDFRAWLETRDSTAADMFVSWGFPFVPGYIASRLEDIGGSFRARNGKDYE